MRATRASRWRATPSTTNRSPGAADRRSSPFRAPSRSSRVVSATMAVVALAFAIVVATGLRLPVGGLLALLRVVARTIALAAWRLPLWFRASAQLHVTDKHVIWQRGRLRRTIERDAISYAVIRWNTSVPGRRRPRARARRADGRAPSHAQHHVRGRRRRPTASGRSCAASRRARRSATAAARSRSGSTTASASSGPRAPRASRWTRAPRRDRDRRQRRRRGRRARAPRAPRPAGRDASSASTSSRPSRRGCSSAAWRSWCSSSPASPASSVTRRSSGPVLLARKTRYFVTDRRVLIRRGNEELHLDRQRIAYVITAPWRDGGTRARSLPRARRARRRARSRRAARSAAATSERLVPMFAAIEDADTATELLHVSRIRSASPPGRLKPRCARFTQLYGDFEAA